MLSVRRKTVRMVSRCWHRDSLVLLPGLSLAFMGGAVLFAPQLLAAVFGLLLVFGGAAACIICWKTAQLKQRFDKLMSSFEGQILIHRGGPQLRDLMETGGEEKKITFH